MDEKKFIAKDKKSPGLAAVISAIFPGAGFFYIGNHLKGFVYMIIFASLIILEVNSSTGFHSRVPEIVFFGLMIAGFYFFQIFDSYNDAKKTGGEIEKQEVTKLNKEEISLFGSIIILIIGILFLLQNLDVLRFRDIIKLWPLFLIAVGIKLIFNYLKKEGDKKDEQD
jgi:TM2 domain-containing membrane protein YozV